MLDVSNFVFINTIFERDRLCRRHVSGVICTLELTSCCMDELAAGDNVSDDDDAADSDGVSGSEVMCS